MINFNRNRFVGVALSIFIGATAHAADSDTLATQLYPAILAGSAQKLEGMFEIEPKIDTPRTGPLRGVGMWRRFLEQEASWLHEIGVRADGLKVVKTRRPAPARVHATLLRSALAWQAQMSAQTHWTPARLQRLLAQSVSGKATTQPGTRLVREWQGRLYQVTVLPEGFEYEGSYEPYNHSLLGGRIGELVPPYAPPTTADVMRRLATASIS